MSNNKFFDDFAKLADSAINTATGSMSNVKNQFDNAVDEKIDSFLKDRKFVTYEEFAVFKELVQKQAEEIESLKSKIND